MFSYNAPFRQEALTKVIIAIFPKRLQTVITTESQQQITEPMGIPPTIRQVTTMVIMRENQPLLLPLYSPLHAK